MQPFTPEESEDHLYNLVSDYLRRDNLQALPASQRSLMTLVLRKLLASSTFAIAGALETLSKRLQRRLEVNEPSDESLSEELDQDYEAMEETSEEWPEEPAPEALSEATRAAIEAEVKKLEGWADDLKLGLEREIKDLDRQIKEARRFAIAALSLEEKLAGQKKIKALEIQRGQKRRSLFDAQDGVERQRDQLIESIESKLTQKVTSQERFFIR